MKRWLSLGAAVAWASVAFGAPAPLEEGQEVHIACEWRTLLPVHEVPVFEAKSESEAALGAYHYRLWLPKGYHAQPERRWPCMFIASPSGNAEMGNMAARLKEGWIVAMLVESRNGPWAPIVGNFLAAHDDLVQRVRVQDGLKFATGMSGGARAASLFVQLRPGFAGLILQGAGLASDPRRVYIVSGLRKTSGFLVGMILGESDQNRSELERVKAALPGSTRFHPVRFPGGHEWAPKEKFAEVLDWMERQIYVEMPARPELKPVYTAYLQRQFAEFRETISPWQQFQTANELLAFARARQLATEPSLTVPLRELQATATQLRSDPAIVRESTAADAWKRLQVTQRGASASKIASDLRAFAKQYAGTEAGKEAEKRLTPDPAGAAGATALKTFTFTSTSARSVFVAGGFNGWNTKATALTSKGSDWSVTLRLPKGRHEYKFIVDGEWLLDPANPRHAADANGHENSIFELDAPAP